MDGEIFGFLLEKANEQINMKRRKRKKKSGTLLEGEADQQ
jgi:hypothetical protein